MNGEQTVLTVAVMMVGAVALYVRLLAREKAAFLAMVREQTRDLEQTQRELHELRAALTAAEKRAWNLEQKVALLEMELEAVKRQRDAYAQELRELRAQIAQVEGRQSNGE